MLQQTSHKRLVRSAATRSHKERPKSWKPPGQAATIDPNCLGPNVRLGLVRKYFKKDCAEEDKSRFFDKRDRGWVPVKATEVKQYAHLSDPDGNILVAGCILCKNDSDTARYDREFYEDIALGKTRGVENQFLTDDADERVPKMVFENKTKVFRQ